MGEKCDKLYVEHVFQKSRHCAVSQDLEDARQLMDDRMQESKKRLEEVLQECPPIPGWICNAVFPDMLTPREEMDAGETARVRAKRAQRRDPVLEGWRNQEKGKHQLRHDACLEERKVDQMAKGIDDNILVERRVDELMSDIRCLNEEMWKIESSDRLLRICSIKIQMDALIADLRNLRFLDGTLAAMKHFTEVYDIEKEVKLKMEQVEALGKEQDLNNQVKGHTRILILQLEECMTEFESQRDPDEDDVVRLREQWEEIAGVRLNNNMPALQEKEAADLRERLARCFEKAQDYSRSYRDRNADPWVYASSLAAQAAKH